MIVCVISRFLAASCAAPENGARKTKGIVQRKYSREAMPDTIETLIKRNLHEVFGERDGKKRREAIAQLWTEDCVFIDHSGKRHGHDELDRAAAVLQQRLPGYVFSELGPVDLLHESGRLAWSYGRPGQEPIKGVDVVLVRDGRISLMLTFLDEVPAKTVASVTESP
jgi:hypothetical protein